MIVVMAEVFIETIPLDATDAERAVKESTAKLSPPVDRTATIPTMTLDELLTTCAGSSPDDWNTITCWGARSGPSYLDQFVPGMSRNDSGAMEFRLHHREHTNRAAYKPDLSINI